MKKTTLTFMMLLAVPVFAQDKTQCRPMGSNDFVHPDESIVTGSSGTQICKAVKPVAVAGAKIQESPAATTPAPANAPAASSGTSTATSAPGSAATSAPASVSGTPGAADAEQSQATIYFYRPHRFVGSALKPSVFVDSTNVGRMRNGDNIKFSVAPGTHAVYSNDKSTGLSLEAKPGQTYYVRIDIQVGAFKGHGGITLMDPQQGSYEIKAVSHQAANN
jgi:hypothetical protein